MSSGRRYCQRTSTSFPTATMCRAIVLSSSVTAPWVNSFSARCASRKTALMTQEAKGERIPEERFRVVLQRCPDCERARHVSGDSEGAGHRVSPELVAEACCGAEVVDLSGDPETRGRLR